MPYSNLLVMTNVFHNGGLNPGKKIDEAIIFEMDELRISLPKKRGLSKCYSGKSRSFKWMCNSECIEDLMKQEVPKAKRRKTNKHCVSPFTGV
ncbi:hypothetical protein GIB67_004822 [Kingdonia uniflora]|uniref:Uncharacterized protein n=1 Tax=Kingdonia uniflora TaxID=39325 RepID=A0A7J7LNL2_9MAGN|nr:hypothetical protein GIB67_004822 [Kingdonia uniflora]